MTCQHTTYPDAQWPTTDVVIVVAIAFACGVASGYNTACNLTQHYGYAVTPTFKCDVPKDADGMQVMYKLNDDNEWRSGRHYGCVFNGETVEMECPGEISHIAVQAAIPDDIVSGTPITVGVRSYRFDFDQVRYSAVVVLEKFDCWPMQWFPIAEE